jgi:hypothetical protein
LSTFLARHRWTFAAALLVAVVYGISLSILPKHVFWMPDEGAKLFELEASSVSWTGSVTYRLPFAGQRLLPGNEFLPGFDVFPEPKTMDSGRLYLQFDTPLVFPLLTAPFFHAFGAVGLYILPVVSGWLIAIISGVLASWFGPLLGPAAVLLVGLATPVWFYSVVFWEHTVATLLGLVAVGLLIRAPRLVESIAATVPVIVLATVFRTEMLVLGAALVVAWVVVGVNGRLRAAAGIHDATDLRGRPPAGRWGFPLLVLVSTVAIGAVLNTSLTARHRSLIHVLPERIDEASVGIANIPHGMFEVFINSHHLGPRMGGAWATAAVAAVLLVLVAPLVRSMRVQAVMVVVGLSMMLSCSAALILTGEPYRGLHGLFPVAPFVILWPFALRYAWQRGDAPLLALGTATWVYLLLGFAALALTYINRGLLNVGMQWGQRYLLTAYPMLVILFLVALRALRASSWPGWLQTVSVTLVVLLVACGVGLEIRGMRMLYGTRGLMAQWDEAMRSEGPIVTSVWWIPPSVADLCLTHELFFTWPEGIPHWVDVARRHGITSFTLAHTEPVKEEDLGVPGIHRVSGPRMVTGGLLLTRFQIDPAATQ